MFCLTSIAYSETDLLTVMQELDVTLRWHPVRDLGVLEREQTRVVFRPGNGWIIHDYQKKIATDTIKEDNGRIVFSENTVALLRSLFRSRGKDTSGHRIAAVLIDPGHGGRDPGAIGTHTVDGENVEIKEKDVVLEVSKHLYRKLKQRYQDKKIFLTRTGDTFPSLEERVEMANQIELDKYEAIIFLSIHANASLNSDATGFEVWYLPPDYRRTLLEPEEVESESKEVVPILNTMLEEEYTVESILLARNILQGLKKKVGDVSEDRGLKEEIWFVVRKAKMPSVLIELGFLTNKEEALRLEDSAYLKKLSEGIYNGVSKFIDQFEQTSGFTEVEGNIQGRGGGTRAQQ
jgi:N-acetylmuramoyl-L-alanine amidase